MRPFISNGTLDLGALRRITMALVAACGLALVASAGVAHAQDSDDDDDSTFEEKIIKNIMTGIGATNMENRGIEYRERSPLVVPPKIELRPPETDGKVAAAPNWPKDIDAEERKRRRALARQEKAQTPNEAARPLMPSELAAGRTRAASPTEPLTPGGGHGNPMLSPSQLGYKGGLFGNLLGNSAESAPFTGEPPRETLTQPPTGYQTPSPNYAYGTGPKESLNQKRYDIMSGKEVKN